MLQSYFENFWILITQYLISLYAIPAVIGPVVTALTMMVLRYLQISVLYWTVLVLTRGRSGSHWSTLTQHCGTAVVVCASLLSAEKKKKKNTWKVHYKIWHSWDLNSFTCNWTYHLENHIFRETLLQNLLVLYIIKGETAYSWYT